MSRQSIQRGFTLVEILIVVAIIGILATITIPMYHKYVSRAYNMAALNDMKNFKTGMEAYFADNSQYPVL